VFESAGTGDLTKAAPRAAADSATMAVTHILLTVIAPESVWVAGEHGREDEV